MDYEKGSIDVDGTRLTTLASKNVAADAPVLVFGHGAGANLQHAHMTAIADALGDQGIGTFRYNFPYMELGKRRVDKQEVCLQTIDAALAAAIERFEGHPILLAGHSFGGRMSSHYAASNPDADISGLVFFSFPLHLAKKPATKRAAHLPDITRPMLFLSGDRDALADTKLLEGVTGDLPLATLHWLYTADHSYKILKRTRVDMIDVYEEAATEVAAWFSRP